ncbi:Sec7-domain-containing protein [Punctularia strigosozonata HHB-11173 SS5]|uniref:Sec7-domain-containing protein n=1 Tax=Punctularia strigosozonata (strain HHB-11173) TaxID=741275 RepID=UPI0004418362|nr:Sec7-domain-containing protein [Punctularia strigosozonata HHB-11173 SS5]EIN10767.1 Sec7-domain-containing protein [Punctularia strigosozonata HHB-11173 SS5]
MADADVQHAANVALPRSPPGEEPPTSLLQRSTTATYSPESAEAGPTVILAGPVEPDPTFTSSTSTPSDVAHDGPQPTNGANGTYRTESPPTPGPPTPPAKAIDEIHEPVTPPARNDSRKSANRPAGLQLNGHIPSTPSTLQPPTPGSATHKRSLTMSRGNTVSVVLISSALETIAASREAKRSAPLKESVQRALEMVRAGEGGDKPREIFEPLRLACETRNEKLMIASLDCISKLISYSFFVDPDAETHDFASPPPSPRPSRHSTSGSQASIPPPSLVDLVVHTITACHTETTPDPVSLQIVKALLAIVLSSTTLVHQSSLLKAVRTVYNVFLLSTDPITQTVAQGGLTQMVHHVFTRCKVEADSTAPTYSEQERMDLGTPRSVSSSKRPSTSASTPETHTLPPLTPPALSENGVVANAERQDSQIADEAIERVNGSPAVGTYVDNAEEAASTAGTRTQRDASVQNSDHEAQRPFHQLSANDLFVKDAFLVFRALCKLTMKPLNSESERDLKSHSMRSKLLSLHLVLTVLNSYMPLFVSPSALIYSSSSHEATPFVQAVNQYLCLSLSRNAVSPVPQVFELSVEIFWRVLSGMRTKLKKEIEVLLHEIFIPIIEMKSSTLKQKGVILGMFYRLCQDPQALVEIYLNYDCDSEASDNIYEHIANLISKIATSQISGTQQKSAEPPSPSVAPTTKTPHSSVPPSYTTTSLAVSGSIDPSTVGLSERQLKRQGLECLVAILKSLVVWGTASSKTVVDPTDTISRTISDDSHQDTLVADNASQSQERFSLSSALEATRQATPDLGDDPNRFESARQKKTTLLEGVKKFNMKPKSNQGVEFFLETGFIPNRNPQDIAKFLLYTDGLSKAMIGEYLGEGDEQNIAIMHAFVDLLDFKDLSFVDALRLFLQSFRLPGEAQKIDRYMLKFAERYIAGNPQTPFANADAAYVLAYSTVMLNTDQHNPQVKKRMTKADFIKNNRGINDGVDLPEEYLSLVFDEIASNEIRMKDEVEAAVDIITPNVGIAGALANVGRDLQREAYIMKSHGMANKTEALLRTMMRSHRRGSKAEDQFFSASHFVHVRPMFEVAWIPFLAGLSNPLQDTDDLEIVELCLDGFKSAIRIVCFFDLELERNAFVTTLAKFTFLNNLGEMKAKNMEAIKALLDIAVTDGNNLKGSWREVLQCVSQLEHMQLITSGVDVDAGRKGRLRKLPAEELANESRSTHITVAADMVFSLSHYLSGTAIVDFVRALCDVSWEEIQSSGLSQHPRLFSLQKLVEISYYNMNRIRLEWSNLWDILGEHFNQVCCHNNPHVGFFALDSLRQLAMRFLEKEELPHFKFQKDFLKPFEYTMVHNANPEIRDMVLQCLQQMIQARVQNLRSGWRTMFGVFTAAAKVLTERIVNSAFEIVTRLNKEHFSAIVRHGSFADLTVCITDFCKASKFQKISLLAIAMLRGVIPVMLECPECALNNDVDLAKQSIDDPMIKFWFPVLFGFYDIIMNGEDLEVRRLALDSLFTTLKTYGSSYPVAFWDTVCQELLFPIFAVLKSSQDLSRFSTQEDMSVWLSTTMIQALRDLVDLYTFHFDILERFLDGLLDLLCVCICQENDTLARIGTSCLQQLLENNVRKLSPARWERVVTTFIRLYKTTTPHQLFDESLRTEIDGNTSEAPENENDGSTILPAPLSPNSSKSNDVMSLSERRRVFKQIIVKCVLQLLLIETTNDLLRSKQVYDTIPPEQLLRLMAVLDHSYQFARMFNEDKELRTGLWKVGFMKHLPNLLKQESSSASTLVHILLQMYYDPRADHRSARPQIADKLLPLGMGVLQDYSKLRPDTQAKNIAAWTPVVAEILHGFSRFDEKAFSRYLPAVYPIAVDILARDLAPEIREGLRSYFSRVGYVQGIMDSSS